MSKARMTLLKAAVYGFDEKLDYGKLGEIIWDGKRVNVEPPKNGRLQSILKPYELTTADQVRRFDPEREPEDWIRNLYRRYLSAELRVYRAREVSPETD